MREVTANTDAIWLSGNFTGDQRPMARVTIQHQTMALYDLTYNVYASLPFGTGTAPVELPNVKSLKWSRGVDTDVATGTLELYNTSPQPLGTVYDPVYGVDQPGFYTYNFNGASFQPRAGGTAADAVWQTLIVPDNILRTYEGYGFDASTCPEADPNLYQTGMWIIKEVEYTVQGLITVTVEDLASILRDQICFYPVIPKNFYPLQFASTPKVSGFTQGYTVTKTVDSGGNYDPAHPPPHGWSGPTVGPTGLTVVAGDKKVILSFTSVPAPSNPGLAAAQATVAAKAAILATKHKGSAAYNLALAELNAAKALAAIAGTSAYKVTQYQATIDNVLMPFVIPASATSATFEGAPLSNGNVYLFNVVAVYERLSDGFQLASSHSNSVLAHPFAPAGTGVVSNIITNDSPPPAIITDPEVSVPGVVGWAYTGAVDTFTIVAFNKAGDQNSWQVVPDGGSATRQFFQTGLGQLTSWDFLIYPTTSGVEGKGDYFGVDGAFFNPPVKGAPPHEPTPLPKGTPTVTKKKTTASPPVTTVLNPVELGIGYSATSNHWYVTPAEDASVYGHTPRHGMDDDDGTYWLSIGNDNPGRDYAFEWFEVTVPNQEVSSVRFHSVKSGYFVYVSVFANGTWVKHHPDDVIPYNPLDPISHNQGNVPYCETINCKTGEGPYEVTLRATIPRVTKVRITYHNLQDFGLGSYPYRAGMRKIKVFGITSSSTSTSTTNGGAGTPTKPPPVPGPVVDDDDPSIVSTYTTYIPPKETPGAGEEPGLYEDYTDIVKLLCAWGGLYWPPNAKTLDSCGNTSSYDFGPGLYGLINVDPVLGGQDAGRVWGDFANTGTAGIANLPVPQWDKKSLLDGISYVRDIIGFLFYIDEQGAAVWRLPNIFSAGNYVGNLAADAGRSATMTTIDEKVTLMDLRAKLSSRNVRERYFIASTDGKTGALAQGYNPNPIGLRRVGGWTDQNFGTNEECLIMADMIALRALMVYRVDTLQIVGYPRIQIDDQVRITESVSQESFLHYVRGISSSNDLESGTWTYDLDTNWLGTSSDPASLNWIFNPAELSTELQAYLNAANALGSGAGEAAGDAGGTVTKDVEKMAKLVKVATAAAVYITDGITKRHVLNSAELTALVTLGLVPSANVTTISSAVLASIPDAP